MQSSSGARLKAYFRCPKSYKREFKEAKCALPISVGQKYHEGETFAATIELINKNNFGECILIMCDSLQRHTIQILESCTEQVAYEKALNAGYQWLRRNYKIYNQLNIPYTIIHWSVWLTHKKYREQYLVVDDLYKTDDSFKIATDNTAIKFLINRGIAVDDNFESKYLLSLEYLKEECAIMLIWINELFNFEIYPGERHIPSSIVYERFIKPFNPNLQKWLHLGFKRE